MLPHRQQFIGFGACFSFGVAPRHHGILLSDGALPLFRAQVRLLGHWLALRVRCSVFVRAQGAGAGAGLRCMDAGVMMRLLTVGESISCIRLYSKALMGDR